MAEPSAGSLATDLANIVDFYKELRNFAENNGANDLLSMQAALEESLHSSKNAARINDGVAGIRALVNSAYNDPTPLIAHVADWGRFLGVPDPFDLGAALAEMRRDFIANTRRFTSRGLASSAITAGGSNTGDGAIIQLTTDDRGFEIETVYAAGDYTARCIQDANTGAERNQERFLFRTGDASIDQLETLDAGLQGIIGCTDPNYDSLIGNASFDDFSGAHDAPSEITDWTVDVGISAGSFDFDTAGRYLDPRNADEVRTALDIKVNCVINQRIDLRNTRISFNAPLYCALAYDRSTGSASGTLALALGAQSNSVGISSGSGYSILEHTATIGTNNWYRNIVEETLDVSITVTNLGGTLRIDDLWLVEMVQFNGYWYAMRNGPTPFRAGLLSSNAGDTFSWSVSGGATGIIQREFVRKFNVNMPHDTAGASGIIGDP